MPRPYLTIAHCRSLIETDPLVHQYLGELIRETIRTKKTSLSIEKFKAQYDHLRPLELVSIEFEKFFVLDYEALPCCYVLHEVAEEMMTVPLPTEPVAALAFANQFALLIRQPNPRTHWYQGLELRFETYVLLWLHEIHGLDVSAFFQSVTTEMKDENLDLRSVDMLYQYAFPYLGDDNTRQFEIIESLARAEETKHIALEAVRSLGNVNPAKAVGLYEYAKQHGGSAYEGLYTHLYKGLYPTYGDRILDEVIELHETNPLESIRAINWLDYNKKGHIRTIFAFTEENKQADIEYLRALPPLYTRLIENPHTPEEIRMQCFERIAELTEQEDQSLRHDLVWRTGMIKGRDSDKMKLFPKFLAWGSPGFISDYFSHFDSPASLFEILRDAYLAYGMTVNLKIFDRAISGQYMLNREQFDIELLKFLSDDLAIIRFAGVTIMMSRYGGSYEVDFLKLGEEGQLRIIRSLLPTPTSIEELMPMLMKLRNSPHDSVRKEFKSGLIGLIAAYDHHLIDMAKEDLDENKAEDKALLESLNDAYAGYKKNIDARLLVKELDPEENELPYFELFYQLEQEKQAEMMEHINRQSFFGQFAKNIHIIRGSAFNSEVNTTITPLAEVGTSRLMDRRHSINPEAYEWIFRMNAMEQNYGKEDAG